MSNTETIFVCRDCRFFQDAKCFHRSAYEFSRTTGNGSLKYAAVNRLDEPKSCGPDAKFFEPYMPSQAFSAKPFWRSK